MHHEDFNNLQLQHDRAMEDRRNQAEDSMRDQAKMIREGWQEILAKRDHRREILRRIENVVLGVGILLVLSMGAWIGGVVRLVRQLIGG